MLMKVQPLMCSNVYDDAGGLWRRSGAFIVNFERVSHVVFLFLLLLLNK